MRHARRSRAAGREHAIDELFTTRGLEADPVGRAFDSGFSLRPFAGDIPTDPALDPLAASMPAAERELRRALDAAARGRPLEAMQRLQELVGREPGHVTARRELAALLETAGDTEQALEHLDAAILLTPDDATLLTARGTVHGRLKHYPESETDLRRAIKLSPDSAPTHQQLGLVLWRKGVPAEAAAVFRRAIALQPSTASSHYYLGEALSQLNELPAALAALEQAVELAPTEARAFQLAGRVLDRLKRPDEAREMYRRAREARPA
ncbi:MAG: tetratricopeptide repeat protein [Gemmatimonadota bacterium]